MTELYRIVSVCLVILALLVLASSAVSASGGRILCYTMWDDLYLYCGFVVDDINIVGSNNSPNSKPWEDDDIEVLLDPKLERAAAPAPGVVRMAISAAGGSSFAVGKDGDWDPRPIFTYKYGPTIQGTLNNPEDTDRSFSVELALPWTETGLKPELGQVIGFNIVRILHGEAQGFVALSPTAKTLQEVNSPANWVEMTLGGPGSAPEEPAGSKLICPKTADETPLIDGIVKGKEWKGGAVFYVEQPQPVVVPKTVDPGVRIENKDHPYPNSNLILARYYYDFTPAAAATLTDQPFRAAGPWMSYDRVQWHMAELEDARKAGIDVILPVYRGDPDSRKSYADRGLDSLAQALAQLKAEGKDYPFVAMFLDTGSMRIAYGDKPDLRKEEVQRTLYAMINGFFTRIPEEFLALTQLDKNRGRASAHIVVLSDADNFSEVDSSFVQYCDHAFARDFGGARLLWIGGSGFDKKVPNLDGYVAFEAGLGLRFNDSGWLDIAAIGPGFDESASVAQQPRVRPRLDGKTYRDDWDELIAKKPDWIIIDSWNGLREGSEVCPSRQYGSLYSELTAVEAMRFRGARESASAYLRHTVPQAIVPQAVHQVEVDIKNVGTKPWVPGLGFALSYRWFKDDRFFDDGIVRVPLLEDILPGRVANLAVGVIAQDKNGQSIPPGQYELHIEMVQGKDKWFSDAGDTPLVLQVRVGLPTSPRARFVNCTLPSLVKTGASYPYKLRVRNDGANPWKRGTTVEVMPRLYKVWEPCAEAPDGKSEVVDLQSQRLPLTADVEQGRVLELDGVLKLALNDGKPLPVRTPGDTWSYRLRWVMWADKKWLGESDGSPFSKTLEVVDADCGAKFISCLMPSTLEAGKTTPATITVVNNGPDVWKAGKSYVGYHWYNFDGSLAVWEGRRTALKTVAPGRMAAVGTKVTAPPNDGQYYLVWDVFQNGVWASSTPNPGYLAPPILLTVQNSKVARGDKGGIQ